MNNRIKDTLKLRHKKILSGSEQLKKLRDRHQRMIINLKKPRDRALSRGHLTTAVEQMSKDLSELEKDIEKLKKGEEQLIEDTNNRRDLLLRDLKKMHRFIRANKIIEEIKRVHSLAEPIGGETFQHAFPNWVSVEQKNIED